MSDLVIWKHLNIGATIIGLRHKNRSRLRRRRGAYSRLYQYLSVGAVIAVIALVGTFVLNQPVVRSADETSVTRSVDPDEVGAEDGAAAARLIPKGSRLGEVRRVVDGDTVYLQDGAKIRLYGIDAPERNQPFGKQSTSALRDMIDDAVYIDRRDVDRYGREVAVLYTPEGVNVNLELVCIGAAWWYERYAKKDKALSDCEASARGARAGLWADDPIAPWEWRRR